MAETWLKCSACRSDIAFGSKYFQCSVSTCNRARMRLVFCSVPCWDSHVATLRHRDAWAEDKIAPTQTAWERELANEAPEPARPVPRAMAATSDRPPPVHVRSPAPSGTTGSPAAQASSTPASASARAEPARQVVTSGGPSSGASGGAGAAGAAGGPGSVALSDVVDRDILIVISKLKKYIKDRSGMNCSDAVAEVLSDHVRALCDDSIRAAGRDERKTVLDRDVPRPRR
jgi:hypothetical protein